ncbi:MAG TPA: hypothetical protein LFV92_01730 [Rickettsia endosymbiont of Ceroptres masudai]|nr:hypothetical protein [Rickettsia endosymbiont of Ceroptres masudai]
MRESKRRGNLKNFVLLHEIAALRLCLSSQGVVAWTNFTSVIPWLDHGIQLKY